MRAIRSSSLIVKLGILAGSLAVAACGPEGDASAELAAAVDAAAARAPSACTEPMPRDIAVPAKNVLEHELSAVGFQIYTCTATPTGAVWRFTEPEATLYDRRGELAGTHYAGPTWEAIDGSAVVAARISGVTPDPTAIPWLLLGAVSHEGSGRMEGMTYVQRVATVGGIAPTTGCDADSLGAVERVPYTAMYCFYEER